MRRLFVNALELHNVTKRFGEKVIANDHVSLTVRRGEILAVLGENGSGKTTLMNMIAGIYHPDEGEIYVNGQPVTISSPRDAFRCGIGMVHQHFKLVDVFTATENIVLGVEDGKPYRLKEATRRVEEISARYGFEIDAKKKIYAMSVSEKQTVEIVKVLYRGAEILILDEPTAVLTPQETEKLFAVLRRMREDGKSIVIITHKLNEVLSLSDRVTVLHKGKNAGTVNTAETNEAQLTEMMVGQKVVLNIERKMPENPEDRLVVKDVSCLSRDGVQLLDRVTFTARAGEILGIAGIAGSGQRELLEAISGLYPIREGSVLFHDPDGAADKELVGMTYRNDVPFKLYPIAQIPPTQDKRLRNFKWVPSLRPTRESVFDRTIRPSVREERMRRERPTFDIVECMDRYKERLLRSGEWIDREDELTPELIEWRNSREL